MKKAFQIFTVVIPILILQSTVFAQTFEWAHKTGTSVIATGAAVATDEHGNSYVTGTFFGQGTFGDFTLKAQGRDIYLAKYDRDGKVLWAKGIGGRADDFGNAVAVDKDGNCYLTGSFAFTMHLGTDSLVSHGQHDMFIAKYSSKGDLLWCKSAGGYYEDHVMSISLDNAGNSYLAGYFKDTMWYGSGKMITGKGMSSFNIFLAKYDAKGNVLWTKPITGANYATQNEGLAIATDAGGTIYVSGYYQSEANFETKKFTTRGTNALFVAKYNTEGKEIWVKSSEGTLASVIGKGIALDKKGNSYIAGTFTSTASFDSISITSKNLGYPEMFLAKYNAAGNIQWVRSSSGFGTKAPYDVAVDAEGNPYVFGTFKDTAIFGHIILSGVGDEHIFLIKYNSKGEAEWAKQIGRHGAVLGKALSIDKQGNLYLTGNFSDTVEFGKAHLKAMPNSQDAFFTKLSPRSLVKEKKLTYPPAPGFTFLSCEFDPRSRTATVKYSIPKPTFVLLEVDDILGNVAESFIEGQRDAGTYEAKLDMKALNGDDDYYFRLQAGREKQTKKAVLQK